MEEDMFEDLLNLEDNYYQDGYRLGIEDGTRAGRIEGRTFGLEKGFEKFFDMGRLQGKAEVWEARMPGKQEDVTNKPTTTIPTIPEEASPSSMAQHVTPLPSNARLAKHIRTLSALAELASLSTANTEDAVSDFDDRLKRARAKAKVIETITGEHQASGPASAVGEKSIEDFGVRSR